MKYRAPYKSLFDQQYEKHQRQKKRYEITKAEFEKQELACKGDEVVLGRPGDYRAQYELLRRFEAAERARQRWIKSAQRLAQRSRWEKKFRRLDGKKLPYSFGLVDMALCFKLFDAGRELGLIDVVSTIEAVKAWFV